MIMQTNEWTIAGGFQWISHLLSYPDESWMQTVAEARESLPSGSQPMTDEIQAFLEAMGAFDAEQRQDHYVQVFDFSKKTTLYLTYADFGEERERGPALLELKKQYAQAGLELNGNEMPDYLPAMLEFCAHVDAAIARQMLSPFANRLAQLRDALAKIESPYAHLLSAVQSGIKILQSETKPQVEEVVV